MVLQKVMLQFRINQMTQLTFMVLFIIIIITTHFFSRLTSMAKCAWTVWAGTVP